MPLIAVRPILHKELSLLKRDALLFDQISVPYLKNYLQMPGIDKEFSSELEWLIAQDFLDDTVKPMGCEYTTGIDFDDGTSVRMTVDLEAAAFSETSVYLEGLTEDGGYAKMFDPQSETTLFALTHQALFIATELRSQGKDAVALLEPLDDSKKPDSGASVASVVLQQFPQPGELTPWEDILSFRQDPDSQHALLSLRRWTRTFASKSAPLPEVRDEVEWLLGEYERHMKLHRMKVNKGALETLLTVGGETLENLAKLKFGKLAKLPFVMRERRIGLLEAELSAPGKDLAYIWKAKRSFDSQ